VGSIPSAPTKIKYNMRIDVEYVRWLRAELAAINNTDLFAIEFYEEGSKIVIADQVLNEWKFVGFNNADFIMNGTYKEPVTIWSVDDNDDNDFGDDEDELT
jgi:hypothetical protein